MNWIKSNPFVSTLAAITLVICGLLFFVASRGSAKYEAAKTTFDEAFQSVSTAESIKLYPLPENRDAKRKTLNEYRDSIEKLRTLFNPYRPEKIDDISPQEFTDRLKLASKDVNKTLEDAGCELPVGFFLGFEKYRTELAQSSATGELDYQLNGIKNALIELAAARPTQLISTFREELPEETGGTYEAAAGDVTRDFGYEVTFKCSENAAREFLSSLGNTKPLYYVVRSVKIQNEQTTPPKVDDAKFEKATPTAETSDGDNPFEEAFVLPDDSGEVSTAPEKEVVAPEKEAVAPVKEEDAPAPDAAVELDSSRILAQVLGSEEVIVFVRFDLTQFLPSQELPKP